MNAKYLVAVVSILLFACITPSAMYIQPAYRTATILPSGSGNESDTKSEPIKPQNYSVATVVYETVNIRDASGNSTGLYAHAGDKLRGSVFGDWFVLQSGNKVWLGCLNIATNLQCH